MPKLPLEVLLFLRICTGRFDLIVGDLDPLRDLDLDLVLDLDLRDLPDLFLFPFLVFLFGVLYSGEVGDFDYYYRLPPLLTLDLSFDLDLLLLLLP